MYLYDTNGKEYLDFVAGIAVNSLGHAHPGLASAIAEQSARLMHCSNLYWTEPQLTLAETLVKSGGFDKVFFCNSGAEGIEGALKLSRKFGNQTGGRNEIIAMENSFHGRTYGAISATGQKKYQKDISPLLPGIFHVPFNDFGALANAITESTCAILLEPVQGEGGIIPSDREYLRQVRELCDNNNIFLIFDEVQCGVGRTGTFFAFEQFGIKPDICVIAKGLGGGFPIGAMLATEKAAAYFKPGDHASTFGGNPLAASAGNVVTKELLHGGLLENVKAQGAYLSCKLDELMQRFPAIIDRRGFGLIQGIELAVPVADIIAACIEKGLLLVNAGKNVIRFVPPLIAARDDINKAAEILSSCLENN